MAQQIRAAIIGPMRRAISIAPAFAPAIPLVAYTDLGSAEEFGGAFEAVAIRIATLAQLAELEVNLYVVVSRTGEVASDIRAALAANTLRPVIFIVTSKCDPRELYELQALALHDPRVKILFDRGLQEMGSEMALALAAHEGWELMRDGRVWPAPEE